MKMKTKDMVILAIAVVVIIGCGYFAFKMLGSAPKSKTTAKKVETTQIEPKFSTKFDTDTLDTLNTYKDYGQASLDNIGRVNPFGPIN